MPTDSLSCLAPTDSPSGAVAEGSPPRAEVDAAHRWDLSHIFPSWEAWRSACREMESRIEELATLEGTLGRGADALFRALDLSDAIGKLSYPVWYFPSLTYDQDQRDNAINAERQRVQVLVARWEQASAWMEPEILRLSRETVTAWLDEHEPLSLYRFRLDDVFRRQAHVLGDEGERILSYASRFGDSPDDAFSALSTADVEFPRVTLTDGREVTVTHGQYRALLATRRDQRDRASVFESFYDVFARHLNTYAALYHGVCQRDWFLALSRRYPSSLEQALDGNAIPVTVVDQLIATTRAGAGPLRRYHRLRQRTLGLGEYHLYDGSVPLVEQDFRYPYDEATRTVLASVAPLGEEYSSRMRQALAGRWIDVHENPGKRSGAYSAGVYGVHPYMLVNYNETLDDLFTLAHELGHTLHTMLSHESQPFPYARYTIFVAEVASTMAEALLLDHLLSTTEERAERITLLQHAIDNTLGTFYSQVLFAEWELEAHRRVERGEPLTSDSLSDLYQGLLEHYYGDAVTLDEKYRLTWARIPHFFHSPYYVYQYATSFAASARLFEAMQGAPSEEARRAVVDRYLDLLRSGGDDYPVRQLEKAGVDLADTDPVEAVVTRLDRLVGELEVELEG